LLDFLYIYFILKIHTLSFSKMNAAISKKEVILGLHKSGKSLNDIQATLALLFENDNINSIEVIMLNLIFT
jgi:hypothetical protein